MPFSSIKKVLRAVNKNLFTPYFLPISLSLSDKKSKGISYFSLKAAKDLGES
tara:strand:+ start:739 stop:894 length:156 start_codon:yes stop_codon:yes gene_type:complete